MLTDQQALWVEPEMHFVPWMFITVWIPNCKNMIGLNRTVSYVSSWPHETFFNNVSQTILISPDFSCTEEILTIVSLLSVDSVLYNPPARRDEVLAVRKKFISSEGDHMTLLNIYRAFKKVSGNKASTSAL